MRLFSLAVLISALLPAAAYPAGFAFSPNFAVYAPEKQGHAYADSVIERAEAFRGEFARQWLGEQLPDGTGKSVIYITFSETEDRGLTWAKDHPGRTLHNVYLTTSPEKALGCTLQHEVAHTVMATRFPHPNRLPPWLEEGVASRFDDAKHSQGRQRLIRSWANKSVRPMDLTQLLEMDDMKSFDESSYAAATSLVEYLLTQGNERELISLGVDGHRVGWRAALQSHYQIADERELQAKWQSWIAVKCKAAEVASVVVS